MSTSLDHPKEPAAAPHSAAVAISVQPADAQVPIVIFVATAPFVASVLATVDGAVGASVGAAVGFAVGFAVGAVVGSSVGFAVGA